LRKQKRSLLELKGVKSWNERYLSQNRGANNLNIHFPCDRAFPDKHSRLPPEALINTTALPTEGF